VLILDLDRGLALHVAVAIDLHAKTCRANGMPFPPELADLAKTCWRHAKGDSDRQEPTSLAELSREVQGGPVVLLVDVSEAAEMLGVSSRQVERLVASGALPSVKVGASRRIRRSDLEAFVASLPPSPFGSRVQAKTNPAVRAGDPSPAGRLDGGRARVDFLPGPDSPSAA
jgi:excisionase family DNA binding protein